VVDAFIHTLCSLAIPIRSALASVNVCAAKALAAAYKALLGQPVRGESVLTIAAGTVAV
jgi:hypothetical protein